jgi:hypothetical protein
MNVIETSRRLGRGERKVLRLQRQLWLAQLAMWPTAIALAVLLVGASVLAWRRSAGGRHRSVSAAATSPATTSHNSGATPTRSEGTT